MSSEDEAVLLPVFKKMQRWGVPIGLPEYLLAIKTLRSGIGLEDAEALKRVCCLLWTKSKEDQEIFYLAFDEFVTPHLQRRATLIADTSSYKDDKPDKTPVLSKDPNEQDGESKIGSQPDHQEEVREVPTKVRSVLPLKPPIAPYPLYQERAYILTPLLPLTEREMAWQWRQLRRVQRKGSASELDVEGTIADICHHGIFRGPVWQSPRRNIATLLLLIDQRGSMVPFAPLIDAFIKSVKLSGLATRTRIYYFHDWPEDVVYEEATLITPNRLQEVLATWATESSVLVVSDAGAARRRFDSLRLNKTTAFIEKLSAYTYLYAWLNPVPPERWPMTTAEEIKLRIPMYYLNQEGLEDTITILRGSPFPPEVRLYD